MSKYLIVLFSLFALCFGSKPKHSYSIILTIKNCAPCIDKAIEIFKADSVTGKELHVLIFASNKASFSYNDEFIRQKLKGFKYKIDKIKKDSISFYGFWYKANSVGPFLKIDKPGQTIILNGPEISDYK
jgi:hypothetical protein